MSETSAAASEKHPAPPGDPVPGGTGSESTAVPMPAQEENVPASKPRPEREPAPKDLLVSLYFVATCTEWQGAIANSRLACLLLC